MTDELKDILREMKEHTKFLKLYYKRLDDIHAELERTNLFLYHIRDNTGGEPCQKSMRQQRQSFADTVKRKLRNLYSNFRERLIS